MTSRWRAKADAARIADLGSKAQPWRPSLAPGGKRLEFCALRLEALVCDESQRLFQEKKCLRLSAMTPARHALRLRLSAMTPARRALRLRLSAMTPARHALRLRLSAMTPVRRALRLRLSAMTPVRRALRLRLSAMTPARRALRLRLSAMTPARRALRLRLSAMTPARHALRLRLSAMTPARHAPRLRLSAMAPAGRALPLRPLCDGTRQGEPRPLLRDLAQQGRSRRRRDGWEARREATMRRHPPNVGVLPARRLGGRSPPARAGRNRRARKWAPSVRGSCSRFRSASEAPR